MDRRKFLGLSGFASALLLSVEETNALLPKSSFTMNKNYELKVLATNWGFPGTMDEYCGKVKKDGYDGIEVWWPGDNKKQEELFSCLKKHQLEVGFLCGAGQTNYSEHLDTFKKMIDAA